MSRGVCVLKAQGTNGDAEMAHAFEAAGGTVDIVPLKGLREWGKDVLDRYSVLVLPGGFSYGDDIGSGRILSTYLQTMFSDQVQAFVEKDRPVLGVCNGFQALIKSGLLPSRRLGEQTTTLTHNERGIFVCRWIEMGLADSVCRFLCPDDLPGETFPVQVAHGEGKFFTTQETLTDLKTRSQVTFRYVDEAASSTMQFPDNPNGSLDAIAGICDERGTILGLMPHPERSISADHPDVSKTGLAREAATVLFRNILTYARSI